MNWDILDLTHLFLSSSKLCAIYYVLYHYYYGTYSAVHTYLCLPPYWIKCLTEWRVQMTMLWGRHQTIFQTVYESSMLRLLVNSLNLVKITGIYVQKGVLKVRGRRNNWRRRNKIKHVWQAMMESSLNFFCVKVESNWINNVYRMEMGMFRGVSWQPLLKLFRGWIDMVHTKWTEVTTGWRPILRITPHCWYSRW